MAASWLAFRRKVGIFRLSGTFGLGVSKEIPPAIRLCSDSLLIWIPRETTGQGDAAGIPEARRAIDQVGVFRLDMDADQQAFLVLARELVALPRYRP